MSDVSSQPQGSPMGHAPMARLLLTMSLPMMLSMLTQAMYSIVSSIFVAQLGEKALTAVSLAFPVQNLMIAVGGGTSIGMMAVISRRLGERNYAEANKTAGTGIFLALMSGIAFAIAGFFLSRLFFESQIDDPEIIRYGYEYLIICTMGSVALFGQMTFERLLQSTGKTLFSMTSQITGALLNVMLDPILIFGWFGCPAFGVRGAAIAMIISQCTAICVAVYLNKTRNKEISFSILRLSPKLSAIKNIYAIGFPTIVMIGISSVMVYGLNKILMLFTPTATAVMGVYFRVQSFAFMPVFGLNNGLMPIIAFNYGARNKERMLHAMRLGIKWGMGIMIAGMVVFMLFPRQILYMFNATADMLSIGVPALRIVSSSFLLAGLCVVAMAVFQAVGKGTFSLACSLIRQLVVLLPAAYLLSRTGHLEYVWFSFPVAEVASFAASAFFLRHVRTNIINPLK